MANERLKWRNWALSYIDQWARLNDTFTAEDVKNQIIEQIGHPHHPNVWGALFSTAVKRGWVTQESYTRGKLPDAHAHHMIVWKSLLR